MKITSIVLALGAVVASVHAALPAPLAGLTQGLSPVAAAAPVIGDVSKRQFVPGVSVATGNPVVDGLGGKTAGIAKQAVDTVTGAAKRSLGLPGVDSLVPKTNLPVKRDVDANVDVTAAVHALVEVCLGPVNDAMAVLKVDVVAQVVAALQVEGNIKVTKAVLKTIEGIVLFYVSEMGSFRATNKYLCLTHAYLTTNSYG